MLTIRLLNDATGTEAKANYEYVVSLNGEIIATGRLEGHNRKDGWQGLLALLAKQPNQKKKELLLSLTNKAKLYNTMLTSL